MPSREAEPHRLPAAGNLEDERDAVRPLVHPARGADIRRTSGTVCPHPRAACRAHGEHARIVGIEDHRPVRGNGANQRGLLLLDAVERAEELGMCARHSGNGGHRGARDGGQRGDLPRAIRAELEGGRAMLGGELEQGEGESPLVVEARLGLEHGSEGPEHAGHQLLGRGLPVRAGDRGHVNAEARAMPGSEAAESHRGIVHEDERHSCGQFVGDGVHHEAARAAAYCVTEKGVTVQPVSADGEEHLAHVEGAAVDRHTGHGDAEIAADEGASGAADDLLDSECRHARSYVALPARAARAWARSSKGSTSEPMI